MFALNVTKKTGYRLTDVYTPVIIRDKRGVLFYSTESNLPNIKSFNLPPLGEQFFVYSGKFKEMDSPVDYNLIELPSPEIPGMPSPIGFEFIFAPNKHKCTISFQNKTITFDTSFREKSLPDIYFILYHEYGHQFFNTEKWADVFASNAMLVKGFNPEQIARSQVTTLSCHQSHRKEFNVIKLLQANGYTR